MEAYTHKVQYYETDQMGIVNHSNYIRWFEEARTDFMEQLGMGYAEMEKEGIVSPVLGVDATYLRMARFGDTVEIKTKIISYNGIKLSMEYEIYNKETGLIDCKGTTHHCFLNRMGKPISLKRDLLNFHNMFLKGLEESQEEESSIADKDEESKGQTPEEDTVETQVENQEENPNENVTDDCEDYPEEGIEERKDEE